MCDESNHCATHNIDYEDSCWECDESSARREWFTQMMIKDEGMIKSIIDITCPNEVYINMNLNAQIAQPQYRKFKKWLELSSELFGRQFD